MIVSVKEKPQDVEKILEESRWRNLYFDKGGKIYHSSSIFPSKAEARKDKERIAEFCRKHKEKCIVTTANGEFSGDQYSWAMQMPII